MSGFGEVKLAGRWLSKRARVPLDMANRAVNLLCALGILSKVPGTGGMRGDRFIFGDADISEVERRWKALGKPSLRRFNRTLVIERLGEDIANSLFRRTPDGKLIRPKAVRDQPASGDVTREDTVIPSEDIPRLSVLVPAATGKVLNSFGETLVRVRHGFAMG